MEIAIWTEPPMSKIEGLVDQVISAFQARRRSHWHVVTPPLTGDDQALQQWRGLVDARLKAFRHSIVDRSDLLDRVRRRYDAAEWTADFAGVADELEKMARDDLRRHLIDNGMPTTAADKVAAGYSIGALLRET
jgi:hypothetical protein